MSAPPPPPIIELLAPLLCIAINIITNVILISKELARVPIYQISHSNGLAA